MLYYTEQKIKKIIFLVIIITILLSVEIVLSLPVEKTETLGTFCVGESEYQLMPGVTLLQTVTVKTYSNGTWSDKNTVFHAYEDNQFELGELGVRRFDGSGTRIPTWFTITYVEVGLFPFRERAVKDVVEG